MATYTKQLLSGSTNGLGIKVAATATPGTTIHTAISGANDLDEIWLYVVNETTVSKVLTLEWGGTTNVDNTMTVSIPAQSGLQLVIPGLLLNNAKVIKAFCNTANVLVIYGFVNRVTA